MLTSNLRILATALLATVGAASLRAQPVPPAQISGPTSFEQQPFDVLHYDALVDLTAAPAKTMSGVCTITLLWSGDPASGPFYFHLRDLKVDSVFYDNAPIMATAVGDPTSPIYHYEIAPPSSARQGDTARVRIVYSGEMTDEMGSGVWGGVSSSGGTLFAMGVGFLNNYVSTTEHWLPCYDHPSDKATFHGRFRVKSDKAVASNGTVTIIPQSDGNVIYDWRHDIPCATYLLTFAVDNYVPLDFPGETPPMVIYARPGDTTSTRITFKLLPRMVHGFEARFGTYPFEKVGYVNTPIGAMEHQTMVSFPTSLSRSRDTVNSTGAHELAHQWFGDLVSPQDYRHAWLNESFATFCESVWMEELGGYAAYLKSQESKANTYFNSVAPSEGIFPLYDFPRTQPSSNYPSTIYQKGAVVVGMLRYEMGDSLFYGGLRDYLTAHAYSVATTEMLRSALEARAGRSLSWFFDQWVYGKGWPVVTVATSRTPIGGGYNRVTVSLTQTQADSLPVFVNLPVELGFASGSAATYRMIRMNADGTPSRSQTFTLDSIPDYATITVNKGPSVRTLMKSTTAQLGVESHAEKGAAAEFVVKPNPLAGPGDFVVDVHGVADCGNVSYELYDSAGRRVMVGSGDDCRFPVPVGTAGFKSGTYHFRFMLRGAHYDVPVVIAR